MSHKRARHARQIGLRRTRLHGNKHTLEVRASERDQKNRPNGNSERDKQINYSLAREAGIGGLSLRIASCFDGLNVALTEMVMLANLGRVELVG